MCGELTGFFFLKKETIFSLLIKLKDNFSLVARFFCIRSLGLIFSAMRQATEPSVSSLSPPHHFGATGDVMKLFRSRKADVHEHPYG